MEEIFTRNVPRVRTILKGRKIGIAGCGGLGSNLALNLARMGADTFVLVDFDKIEPSNLNRQFYFYDQVGLPKAEALKANLLRVVPNLKLEIKQVKLDASNIISAFTGCVVVAECFDGAGNKALLTEMLISKKVPVVAVSGLAGDDTPEKIRIKKPLPFLTLIGDESSPPCEAGLMSARVSTAAAYQAWAILEVLKNEAKG